MIKFFLLTLIPTFLFCDELILSEKKIEYHYEHYLYFFIFFLYVTLYPIYKRRIYIKQNINFYKLINFMYKKTFFFKESLKSFYLIIIEMFYNVVYLLGFIAFVDILFKFLNENEKYSLFKYEEFINSLFTLTIIMFIINFLLGTFYILYRFIKNKKILKR